MTSRGCGAARGGRWLGIAVAFALVVSTALMASPTAAGAAPSVQQLTNSQINSTVTAKLGKLKLATGHTTTGINGKTITIEGIASVTEAGQPTIPGLCDGAAAAFARADRTGGVNGYTINYLGCHDDGTVAATANQLAQKAVYQDHVFAVVPYSSAVGSTQIFNQKHVPYFGFGFDQAAYCGWNNLQFGFSVTSAESCIGAVGGDSIFSNIGLESYLQGANIKPTSVKLALLSEQLPDNESAANAEVLMARQLGMKVVYNQPAIPGPQSPQLSDYSPIAQQILSSGANFLFDDASGASILGVLGALKNAGWTGKVMQFTFTDATYLGISSVAQAMNGAYALTAQVGSGAFPSPQIAQVESDLKAIKSTAGLSLGTLSSYGAAELFLAALKRVKGQLTTEKLAAVLNSGFSYPGFGNVVCPSTWPAAHVAASSCGALVTLDGTTASLKPVLNLGTYGNDYLIRGLANTP